jgi:hypothetical protein
MPDVPLIVFCSMATDGFKAAVLVGEVEMLLRDLDAVIRAIGHLLAGSRQRPFARSARPGLPGRALETRRAATRTQMAERTARR